MAKVTTKKAAKKKEPVKYHTHIDLLVTGAVGNPSVPNILEVAVEADVDEMGRLTNIKLGDGSLRMV